jgi:pyruvate dehydrogenase E1 component alpha subunit
MKAFLYKQQLADRDFFAGLDAEADALAARVRAGCLEMTDPDPLSMFDDVYDETPPQLQEQQAAFEAYLAGFASEGAVH